MVTPVTQKVAHISELGKQNRLVVDLPDRAVLIIAESGAYYAIDAMCSHADFGLEDGLVEAGAIVCPLHGARFCIRTGRALSAPATRDLRHYPVRVDPDGSIWLTWEPG